MDDHAMANNHEHKVEHLDQPFYGPPVLPPVEPPAAAAARRCVADPYALCCRAIRVLTIVVIAVGVVALVLWLVSLPNALKAYVDAAELTRFDLGGSDGKRSQLLRYNLTVAVSIRNPNRDQAVLYRRLEAVALYGGERFGYVDFPRTRQGRKSTMVIRPSFVGHGVLAGKASAAAFGREKEEGFFNINVKLHMRVRLKVMIFVDSVEYRPDVDCYIRVPDPSNATAWQWGSRRRAVVSTTSCDGPLDPACCSIALHV